MVANTDNDSQVEFLQAYPPALKTGDYQVTVTQSVTVAGVATGNYAAEHEFSVAGPRFTLDPTLIHSMYPPPNHQGDFNKYLPQVVFTRKSLPWERRLDSSSLSPGLADLKHAPWLGILVFNEKDPGKLPIVKPAVVSDLMPPSLPQRTFFPPLTLEVGQQATDPLMVIDVPVTLFGELTPALGDLPLTAHARRIDPSRKVVPAPHNLDGWVSVVIGNRFPEPGVRNGAYLVSFEGFAPPPQSDQTLLGSAAGPSRFDFVRLVCLASWQYTSRAESAGNFRDLMQALDAGERLNLVQKTNRTDGTFKEVQDLLQAGYTAFNHTTRQGEKTVSWNRGPLVPLVLPAATNLPSYQSSDKALKYDPTTGLFDVSYAAAWQIGRLLGLNNRQFSTALFAWRRMAHQKAITALTRMLLYEHLGSDISVAGPAENPVPTSLIKDNMLPFLTTVVAQILVLQRPSG